MALYVLDCALHLDFAEGNHHVTFAAYQHSNPNICQISQLVFVALAPLYPGIILLRQLCSLLALISSCLCSC